MKTKSYPDLDEQALKKLTRTELIEIILDQRQQLDALKRRQDEQKTQQITNRLTSQARRSRSGTRTVIRS